MALLFSNFSFMKKHFTLSNLIFVIAIVLLLFKPTRIWIIGKLSFSPQINEITKSDKLTNYSLKLKGLNTDDINFEDLKGQVILLNYWATWCPPCIAEMPMLNNLYKDYKDKVKFILVTTDSWQKVSAFYNEKGYNFPTYQLQSNLPSELNRSNSIPTTYIIDKSGYIRVYSTGSANWNSKSFRKQLDSFLKD